MRISLRFVKGSHRWDRQFAPTMFVTDDRHPSDLVAEGHIDHMVRKAIEFGVAPVTAISISNNCYKTYGINALRFFG